MAKAKQVEVVTYRNNRTGQTFTLPRGSVAERRTIAKMRGKRIEVDGSEMPLMEQVGKSRKVTPMSRRERRQQRAAQRQQQAQGEQEKGDAQGEQAKS